MANAEDRVDRFVAAAKDDPRVVGIARFADGLPGVARIFVVTTWDGFEPLTRELPRLGSPLLADGSRVELVDEGRWTGLDSEGARAEIELRRVGDLVPDRDVDRVVPLFDPRGLIDQWARYCRAAPAASGERSPDQHAALVLGADAMLRDEALPPAGAHFLRNARRRLAESAADSIEATVAARLDRRLASESAVVGAGKRALGGVDPVAAFESFLAVADDEGFRGDRVLFGEATKRLAALAKREALFEHGFVVPTFDAVEAAFALGEAVGGCKPPLVPGVYVGVGVTPKDALEFWAAPYVRDPTCSVASVDDLGERDVVERASGRDAMVSSLTNAVDAAYERLPALIESAREAQKDSVDPSAVLATLHLPKSFVERAKRRGADALMCSRLTVALSLARAGDDAAPLVARKLGLAAGRALAKR